MHQAECLMSQRALRSLSRKGWRLTRVEARQDRECIDCYELNLESRRFLSRQECRVAVWRGKLNILCCDCQYIAEFAGTSFSGLGFDGGLIRITDVLLADSSRTDVEFRFTFSDADTGDMFHRAVNFFDTLNFPDHP